MDRNSALYRTIWRWHFYAAVYVLPFIILLSMTGALYLFKPQIDRWEERAFRGLDHARAVSPNEQLDAVLSAFPGARFHAYRLPEAKGDAAMIHVGLPDGKRMLDVFVSPSGDVLGSLDPESRIAMFISRIHGELLAGRVGSWLVELAACWAIVMIATGLYLWWPRGGGLAGIFWPRLASGRRVFWRDLHAVTGFWVSGLALVLLVTGLPWASVWGDAFRLVRTEFGLVKGAQNWKTGPSSPDHSAHDHQAMLRMQAADLPLASLSTIVAKAGAEKMAFPVLVKPPGAPERFGPPHPMTWVVKSEAQNRTLNRTIAYDMATGREVSRQGFADKHPIDRAINYGISWHEGQLFGWFNQLVGVMTALALVTLAGSGLILWQRRKPGQTLGAPPAPQLPARSRGALVILVLLAALMPLLALSLLVLWLFDRLIAPRLPGVSAWLGLTPARSG
jgi:uncharacterized iron-regulated membrane protein